MRPSQQVLELATVVPRATTDEMLHKLLSNLTALLGARRAYVTEVVEKGTSRSIASWEDGQRGPVREYDIRGTPCAMVMRDGTQVIDCELSARFMFDDTSLGYGCESFIGSPIVDHRGDRIGQLCVFGASPLGDSEMAGALVALAAVRVSAELEHSEHTGLAGDTSSTTSVCYPTTAYEDAKVVDTVVEGSGFCNEFDRMNAGGDTHSSEANLEANPDGSKLYGVWTQWVVDELGEDVIDSEANVRRIWWIDNWRSGILENVWTLQGINQPE